MKNCLILFFFCFASAGFSQNLVPNPSFEDKYTCPLNQDELSNVCKFWTSYRLTPDYFDTCSQIMGIHNVVGFQVAKNGSAYAGFIAYGKTSVNLREYLGVELTTELVVGQKYYASFYVSPAYEPSAINIVCNKLGLRLTTFEYFDPFSSEYACNCSPIYTEEIISDTSSWHKISGEFIADSSYRFLSIGNFFMDSELDTIQLPSTLTSQRAYYYVDDVCISIDSNKCDDKLAIFHTQPKNNVFSYTRITACLL